MPIYSEDKQNNQIPKKQSILKEIYQADALVISLAEHVCSYTAAFKNIYDWISVIEMMFGVANQYYYYQLNGS